MPMTDGPVHPAPHTVKTLLRRPFRLNLPGNAPQDTSATTAQPSAQAPAQAPAIAMPKAKARTPAPVPATRRPLTELPPAAGRALPDPPPKPAKPQAQLSRPQILAATADCLDHAGYDGTTIRMIARSLDCAVGSIYRYFTDKRELLDTVVQQRFLPVAEAVEAGTDLPDTLAQYRAAATHRPEQYRLMFWLAAVGRTPDQPAAVPEVIQRILNGWAKQLDGTHEAHCQWAQLHGGLMLGLDLHCDESKTQTTADASA